MSGQTPARPLLAFLDDQAGAVGSVSGPAAIKPIVDALIGVSLFSTAAKTFHSRLLNAEVNARKQHSTVSNSAIVAAIDAYASSASLPDYASTIPEQLLTIRLSLLKFFPNLLGPTNRLGNPEFQDISPIGAFFLIDLLLRQKLHNPLYRVTPAQWLQQRGQVGARPGTGPSLSLGIPDSPAVSAFLARLQAELPNESSASGVALRLLFDSVGF